MTGSDANLGVIPMAIRSIFKKTEEAQDREYLIRLSYIEIYREVIIDLLRRENQAKQLKIRGEQVSFLL